MVRLVVSLVILAIVLVIRLIVWIVQESTKNKLPPPLHGHGPQPGHSPPGWAPLGGQNPGYSAPAWPPQGPQPTPAPAATAALRLVARPDCGFERVSACMSHAGLRLAAPPGPAQQPGEPSSALWQNDAMQVMYTFDARTYLRAIQIQGPSAEHLRQHLVNVAGLPALDGQQVVQMLLSQRPADQMLGLVAAEVLGTGQDARHYLGQVSALSTHPNPEIAGTARRVQQLLHSQLPYGT